MSRLLRPTALLSAFVFAAGILTASAEPAQAAKWPGEMNLYRPGVFVTQYTWTWCVGASSQAMLNIIRGTTNQKKKRQRKLVNYAMAHDQFLDSNKGGSDAVGWAATLTHFGGGRYVPSTANNYRHAVRKAVKRIAKTGKPVGLLVMGGRHAWVLTGFESNRNPAKTNNFVVSALYVLGPLYPKQKGARGFYDLKPNTRLSWKKFKKPFRRFDDPDSPDFVGYWVTVLPALH